jgi:hypothetical protein
MAMFMGSIALPIVATHELGGTKADVGRSCQKQPLKGKHLCSGGLNRVSEFYFPLFSRVLPWKSAKRVENTGQALNYTNLSSTFYRKIVRSKREWQNDSTRGQKTNPFG